MKRSVLLFLIVSYSITNYGQIIADHTVVDRYDDIPQYYIDLIKKMWLVVPGESHSQAYRTGMTLLASSNPTYNVKVKELYGTPDAYSDQYLRISNATWGDYSNSTGWMYSYGEEDWFTNATAISRTKAGITYCNTNNLTIAAIGFGWCWDETVGSAAGGVDPVYGVHWFGGSVNGPEGDLRWGLDAGDFSLTGNTVCMDTYLNVTQDYINYCTANGYPTKVFFTTGPVETYYAGESGYQGHLKHNYIRDFVKADPSRILFDYADILCYDDNGLPTTSTWNGHTYPIITATNLGDASIGHIGSSGAIRLAKAMWWMLARMAGWDGTFSVPFSVTSPGSGEILEIGSIHDITWTSSGTSGTIGIEYSTNNGTSWTNVIASTPDDGSYSWTTPDAQSTTCLVRISDTDGSPVDISDAVFTISSLPLIIDTSPNGGEAWLVGSIHNITWTSSGTSGTVRIEYSTNNGTGWTNVIASTPDDGSYSWTIPDAQSTACLVRISDTDGSPVDISDGLFTILSLPLIIVTSPDGGEVWPVGSIHNLTWASSGTSGTVRIEYSTSNGASWISIISSTPDDGSYSWTIPDTQSTTCLVRISDTDGSPVDISDVVFSITPSVSGGCINETFTTASGTVTDNSGALNYLNNMSCEKLIQPSGGGSITLTFTAFNTEAGYDFVRVYNGSTTSAPLLGTFSGSSLPASITATSGSMLIRFTTDYNVVAAGWSAAYTSGVIPASITITSPNGGEVWPVGSIHNLTWASSGTSGTVRIEYSTSNGASWISIISSTPDDGSYSWTIPDAQSTTCLVRISDTDGSPVDISDVVFSITPSVSGGCINETFTTASGTVTDNSGALNYLNNMSCEKLIQPSGGGSITLTFTAFNTEAGYDFVRVYNGSTTSAPLLGTFSGSSLPASITATSGSMLIRFTTDYNVVAAGWSAAYTSGVIPASITITSPNGGEVWPVGSIHNLTWASSGTSGTVRIEYSTSNGASWISIISSTPDDGSYSWTIPDAQSTTCLVRISDTDGSPVDISDVVFSITPSVSGGCINETFTTASGTVTDNSGALNYLNNMSCEKLIQPSGGGSITLTFTAFNTEAGYDFVRVYNGSTTSAPLLGTFSGSSLPASITATSGSMLIRFTTDYSVAAAGWSATFTSQIIVACVNEIFTTASGTVTDNSGALNYQNNMSCEKLIQPSGGGSITLTFTAINTEAGYDFVRVYNGSTTSAPLLGTISGSSLPAAITATSGSMLIRFTTDYSVVAAGWSATFTTGIPSGAKGSVQILEKKIIPVDQLIAYPNPTTGILSIESSIKEEKTYTIDLINYSGLVILSRTIKVIGGKFDIDISDVSYGFYILKIRNDRTVKFIRVIKN